MQSSPPHATDMTRQPAIRSITGLRSSGQNRQFQEDFQYLVLDLSATQSLALRRSTCVEIVKKIMSVDEEESEGEENGRNGATGLAPPKLSLLTPFLRQIKKDDLARTLWLQLRQAEAGSGKDEVLDLSLALICAKIVHCDKGLALVLCKETGFSTCMACLMGTPSGRVTLQDKTGLKCLKTLKEFVRSGTRARATEGPLIAAVILEVVSALADLPDLPLRIGQVGPDVTSIASQMWCLISAQAQLAARHSICDSMEDLDHHPLDLIAQTFVNCASQVGSADDPHPVTSPTDLITLLRCYARSCDQRSEERQLEPVCSLLRMTVALAASERCNWVAGLVNAEGTVEVLLQLASQSASMVASTTCEESQSGGLDLLTLALALLTDLLVKEPGRVRSLVLAASVPTKPVLLLAQVLQQQRRKEALDAGAGYLAGSLAVVLALLVVGKEAEGGKAVQTEVMAQLVAGLQSDSVQTALGILVVTLDEFVAVMQVVSKTFHRLGRASAHADEAAEDEGFFARLSSALALLLSMVDG